jgi:zinc protease
MPVDPSIIIGELPNGMRYFIRENPYPAGRVDLRLVVKVGSLLEDDDQLGIAHFVEHMSFNGTEP